MVDENSSRIVTGAVIFCTAAACVAAYYAYLYNEEKKRNSKVNVAGANMNGDVVAGDDNNKAYAILEEFAESASTPVEKLWDIVDVMAVEMSAGLREKNGSRLKMLPSFVEKLPEGNERGLFYALDLGGTNFRVLRSMLGGLEGRIVKQEYEEIAIPPKLMSGTTEELFDFIAVNLAAFVATESDEFKILEGQQRELGFTFSFPCDQTAIDGGTLIRWTKGFTVEGTVGKDVVQILDAAMKRQSLDMKVAVLVNDTVGTLAGAHYWNGDTKIAVILGTGSNACYIEKADKIGKWEGPAPASGEMTINMEWGNFWSTHLPITYADEELDAESNNPGEQIFEKLISGMYLGDIVRRVLLKMAIEAQLFGPEVPEKLKIQASLPTPRMSKMEEDETPDLSILAAEVSKVLEIEDLSMTQRRIIHKIISIVAERGARLAAAGIVGVLKKIGRDHRAIKGTRNMKTENIQKLKTSVAVDGGLYEHYSKFRAYMHQAVSELLGQEAFGLVQVELSKDGSGIGAALLAASLSDYNVSNA